MINKIALSVADALADVKDGATVLIGGFGTAGIPAELIDGLIAQGARDLTVVVVPGHHGDVDDDRVGMLSEQHVGTLAARVSAASR